MQAVGQLTGGIAHDFNNMLTAIMGSLGLLAVNAQDAIRPGGRLTIQTANIVPTDEHAQRDSDLTAGDDVMIAVSNTGTGMTPAVMEHAFEPCFTTKEVGRITGLGLSQVYGFVKQSGGHLELDSESARNDRTPAVRCRDGGAAGPEDTVHQWPRLVGGGKPWAAGSGRADPGETFRIDSRAHTFRSVFDSL